MPGPSTYNHSEGLIFAGLPLQPSGSFYEVKLRACIKIGELSRDLEKAESHGGKIRLPTDGKSKTEQLKEAGISKSIRDQCSLIRQPAVDSRIQSHEI
jgi:hypothetical protein